MDEKVEKYYGLAYGARNKANPEKAFTHGHRDKMFILKNLQAIESLYEEGMRPGSGLQRMGMTEEEIMQDSIAHVKIDKYYDMAYGARDKADPEKAFTNGRKDRMFIRRNLEAIDEYYNDCMDQRSGAQQMGMTEEEIVKDAITHIKVDKYYDMAYGARDKSDPEKAFTNGRKDRMFILKNLEAIEAQLDAPENAEKSPEEKIKAAIESVNREITTREIGKATINAPTVDKMDAERVENQEITKDKSREGEELGE